MLPESSLSWAAFKDLALYRELHFDFRPWLSEMSPLETEMKRERHRPTWYPLCSWALVHGGLSFLRILLPAIVSEQSQDVPFIQFLLEYPPQSLEHGCFNGEVAFRASLPYDP